MERVGSERRDERLYVKEYGFDEDDVDLENEDELANLYHEVMMNSALVRTALLPREVAVRSFASVYLNGRNPICIQYPTLESTPTRLFGILRDWHDSASAYTQRITKDGETYAGDFHKCRHKTFETVRMVVHALSFLAVHFNGI